MKGDIKNEERGLQEEIDTLKKEMGKALDDITGVQLDVLTQQASAATTLNSVSLHVEEARAAISQLGLDHHDATKDHVKALESNVSKCEKKWVKGARGLSTSSGQAEKSIEAATTFCGLLMDRLDVMREPRS